MFMRTDTGRLYESWSRDNGETWSEGRPTQLMSVNSPAQLRKVPGTGDLLVVFNQGSLVEAQADFYRSRLSTAISRDQGKTWTHFQNIESSIEGVHTPARPIELDLPWIVEGLNPRDDDLAGFPPRPPAADKKSHGRLYARFTYPSAIFHGDRLIIGHPDYHWDKNGKLLREGRLRVVPISWLYGGKQARAI